MKKARAGAAHLAQAHDRSLFVREQSIRNGGRGIQIAQLQVTPEYRSTSCEDRNIYEVNSWRD